MNKLIALIGTILLANLLVGPALAQPFKLKDLDGKELKAYSESHSGMKRVNKLPHDDWFELRTTFDLDVEWVDEVAFKYFALLKGERSYSILAGDVAYQNVPKGSALPSVMYIHPTTYARLGKVVGIHVEVSVNGRKIDAETKEGSGNPPKWWTKGEPKRLLKRKDQTPFISVNSDSYLDIKTDGGR